MKNRFCKTIDCNTSISDRGSNAQYCQACATERAIKGKAAMDREYRRKAKESCVAVGADADAKRREGSHRAWGGKFCLACEGMSWRRPTHGCDACGEPHAAEESAEPFRSALVSSMGMAGG